MGARKVAAYAIGLPLLLAISLFLTLIFSDSIRKSAILGFLEWRVAHYDSVGTGEVPHFCALVVKVRTPAPLTDWVAWARDTGSPSCRPIDLGSGFVRFCNRFMQRRLPRVRPKEDPRVRPPVAPYDPVTRRGPSAHPASICLFSGVAGGGEAGVHWILE